MLHSVARTGRKQARSVRAVAGSGGGRVFGRIGTNHTVRQEISGYLIRHGARTFRRGVF